MTWHNITWVNYFQLTFITFITGWPPWRAEALWEQSCYVPGVSPRVSSFHQFSEGFEQFSEHHLQNGNILQDFFNFDKKNQVPFLILDCRHFCSSMPDPSCFGSQWVRVPVLRTAWTIWWATWTICWTIPWHARLLFWRQFLPIETWRSISYSTTWFRRSQRRNQRP